MPAPTVVKAGEHKPAEPVSSAPAVAEAASEPAQSSASATTSTAAAAEQTYRTGQLLRQWPAVELAVHKGSQAYCSVKQSARFVGWALGLAETAVGSVVSFAEAKVSRWRPVVQYADRAVSEGVLAVEKKFPALRESPEKLYDAVTQQITKIVRPVLDRTASISEIGREKMNRVSKKIVKMYHRLLRSVDNWLDALEKRTDIAEPEAVPGVVDKGAEGSAPEPQSVVAVSEAPPSAHLWQAARACCRAVSALSAFQVGLAWWLLANTPIVGRLFENSHPRTSMASSSSSSDISSSSSLSPPAAAEGLAL